MRVLRDAWDNGDKALQYTLIAVTSVILLGVILVPMSLPDEAPVQSRASLLAERYLATLPTDAKRPTLAEIESTYGSDGGEACTSKASAVYNGLLTPIKTASGKTGKRLDRAGLTSTTRMMQTYCPAQAEALETHADKQAAALKRKQSAAKANSNA